MNKKESYIYFDKDTDFSGEVESSRVILEGKIYGVIHADKEVHLKSGAFIEGDVYTGHFKADIGSSYFGELQVNRSNESENNKGVDNGKAGNKKSVFMRVASMLTAL